MNLLFQNVYVRLAVYGASLLPGLVASWGFGWFIINFTDGWLNMHLQIEGAAAAAVGAVGTIGAVYKKFGTK